MDDKTPAKLRRALELWLPQGKIPCAKALALANHLELSPGKVGQALEELGIKVTGCQLGCFDRKKGDAQ
jgi:hypothetical protein